MNNLKNYYLFSILKYDLQAFSLCKSNVEYEKYTIIYKPPSVLQLKNIDPYNFLIPY